MDLIKIFLNHVLCTDEKYHYFFSGYTYLYNAMRLASPNGRPQDTCWVSVGSSHRTVLFDTRTEAESFLLHHYPGLSNLYLLSCIEEVIIP